MAYEEYIPNTYKQIDDEQKGKDETTKRGVLDRVLSPLMNTSVTSALYNITDDNPNTTFLSGIGAGIERQFNPLKDDVSDTHEFADVMDNVFGKPDTVIGKGVRAIGGFVGDTLLDPMSYVTSPLSVASKVLKGTGRGTDALKAAENIVESGVKVNNAVNFDDCLKVIRNQYKDIPSGAVDLIEKAQAKELYENWNRKILKRQTLEQARKAKGVTIGVCELPFSSKLNKNGKLDRVFERQILSDEALRKFGDKTVAPYYNDLVNKIRTTKLGQAFSNNNKIFAESLTDINSALNRFATTEKMQKSGQKIAQGMTATYKAASNIDNLSPEEYEAFSNIIKNGYIDDFKAWMDTKLNIQEKIIKNKNEYDEVTVQKAMEMKSTIKKDKETATKILEDMEKQMKNKFSFKDDERELIKQTVLPEKRPKDKPKYIFKTKETDYRPTEKSDSSALSKIFEKEEAVFNKNGKLVFEPDPTNTKMFDHDIEISDKDIYDVIDEIDFNNDKNKINAMGHFLLDLQANSGAKYRNNPAFEQILNRLDYQMDEIADTGNHKHASSNAKMVNQAFEQEQAAKRGLLNINEGTLDEQLVGPKKIGAANLSKTERDALNKELDTIDNRIDELESLASTPEIEAELDKLYNQTDEIEKKLNGYIDNSESISVPKPLTASEIYEMAEQTLSPEDFARYKKEVVDVNKERLEEIASAKNVYADPDSVKMEDLDEAERAIKQNSDVEVSKLKTKQDAYPGSDMINIFNKSNDNGEVTAEFGDTIRQRLNEYYSDGKGTVQKYAYKDGKYILDSDTGMFNQYNCNDKTIMTLYKYMKNGDINSATTLLDGIVARTSSKNRFKYIDNYMHSSDIGLKLMDNCHTPTSDIKYFSAGAFRDYSDGVELLDEAGNVIDVSQRSKPVVGNTWRDVYTNFFNKDLSPRYDDIWTNGLSVRENLDEMNKKMTGYYVGNAEYTELLKKYNKDSLFEIEQITTQDGRDLYLIYDPNFIQNNIATLVQDVDPQIMSKFSSLNALNTGYKYEPTEQMKNALKGIRPKKRITKNNIKWQYPYIKLDGKLVRKDSLDSEQLTRAFQQQNETKNIRKNVEQTIDNNPSKPTISDKITNLKEREQWNPKTGMYEVAKKPFNGEGQAWFDSNPGAIYEIKDGQILLEDYYPNTNFVKFIRNNEREVYEECSKYLDTLSKKLDEEIALRNSFVPGSESYYKHEGKITKLNNQIEHTMFGNLDDLTGTDFMNEFERFYNALDPSNNRGLFGEFTESAFPEIKNMNFIERMKYFLNESKFLITDDKEAVEFADNLLYSNPKAGVGIDSSIGNMVLNDMKELFEREIIDGSPSRISDDHLDLFAEQVQRNKIKNKTPEQLEQIRKVRQALIQKGYIYDKYNSVAPEIDRLSIDNKNRILSYLGVVVDSKFLEKYDSYSALRRQALYDNVDDTAKELIDKHNLKKRIFGDPDIKNIPEDMLKMYDKRVRDTIEKLDLNNKIYDEVISGENNGHIADRLASIDDVDELKKSTNNYDKIIENLTDEQANKVTECVNGVITTKQEVLDKLQLMGMDDTKRWLESGFIPKTRTAEADMYIQNHREIAKELTAGLDKLSIEDANELMAKRTNGSITKWYNDNATDMYIGAMLSCNKQIQYSQNMNHIINAFTKPRVGNPVKEGETIVVKKAALMDYIKKYQSLTNEDLDAIKQLRTKLSGKNDDELNKAFSKIYNKTNTSTDYIDFTNLDKYGISEDTFKTGDIFIELSDEQFNRIKNDLFSGKTDALNGYIMKVDDMKKFNQAAHAQNIESEKAFWKMYDRFLAAYKTANTVINPGFHINNAFGGACNSFFYCGAAAFDPNKIKIAHTIITNPDPKQFIKINDVNYSYKELNEMMQQVGSLNTTFFKEDIGNTLSRLKGVNNKQGVKGSWADLPLIKQGLNAGAKIEATQRAVVFIEALRNGETIEGAAEMVNKFLFDYSDLTVEEIKYMKRAIPFYTFMRKNIPFQLEQMIENPKVFRNVDKGISNFERLAGANYVQDEDRNEWRKDYVQMPFKVGGENFGINLNLPMQQLDRISPRKILGQSSPAIKTPIELSSGEYAYTGMPINNVGEYMASQLTPVRTMNVTKEKKGVDKSLYPLGFVSGFPMGTIKEV